MKTKTEKLKDEIKKLEEDWKSPRDDFKWTKRNTMWFEARAELKGRTEMKQEVEKLIEKVVFNHELWLHRVFEDGKEKFPDLLLSKHNLFQELKSKLNKI